MLPPSSNFYSNEEIRKQLNNCGGTGNGVFYTYAYLRTNGRPYYVGKGKRDRCISKIGRATWTPSADRILILKYNLTEEEAYKHEIYMISVLGRKTEGGLLRNKTKGGDGLRDPSPETRIKLSIAAADPNHPCHSPGSRVKTQKTKEKNNTLKHTQKTKDLLRESKLGDKNPQYGKDPWNKGKTLGPQSEAVKQAKSEKLKGRPWSAKRRAAEEERRRKRSTGES